MATYTTIANITKVALDGKFYIKGIGKYSYEKEKDEKYIVLENETVENSKFIKEDSLELFCEDVLQKDILVSSMLNKKALKMTIEKSGKSYKISAIEVP